MNEPALLRILTRASLWSALAFVLNLTWEIAHVRLYTIWMEADGPGIALAGVMLWRADWPGSRPWAGGAIVVIGAIAYTVWSEWHNVYRAGNWGYTASMPMIFGIRLSPLLQWLILPPVMVAAYRTLRGRRCYG